jgi:hypothetical protein
MSDEDSTPDSEYDRDYGYNPPPFPPADETGPKGLADPAPPPPLEETIIDASASDEDHLGRGYNPPPPPPPEETSE